MHYGKAKRNRAVLEFNWIRCVYGTGLQIVVIYDVPIGHRNIPVYSILAPGSWRMACENGSVCVYPEESGEQKPF